MPAEVTQLDLQALRIGIANTFSPSELRIACFDLGIVYDNIPGDTHDLKVLELIQYANRHGGLQDLVAYVHKQRPHLILSRKAQTVTTSLVTVEERVEHRLALRADRKDINLVHTLRPYPFSSSQERWYDILIYLIAHHNSDLSIVRFAEFFLGPMWSNRIFKVDNQEGFVGIGISAYGPVLCTCRVVFKDNHETLLERYIDFEMANPLRRADTND